MPTLVHIDGRICPLEDAKVPVLDRGFLYGDSVYETVGTAYGRLFALADHLTRLERSAARIGLAPPPRAVIEAAVQETVAAAGNAESRVRIMVTRGASTLDLDPASAGEPRLVVIVAPLGPLGREVYDQGVGAALVSVHRNSPRAIDPAVKSGNYLNNVLALGEARRRFGAHEAILCAADGSVAEGASSNVFAVADGRVATPPLEVGILDGITRAKVIELAARAAIPLAETRLTPDALRAADELFITSATRAVLPVTRLDDKPIGDGRPGPVTRRIMGLYDALARAGVP